MTRKPLAYLDPLLKRNTSDRLTSFQGFFYLLLLLLHLFCTQSFIAFVFFQFEYLKKTPCRTAPFESHPLLDVEIALPFGTPKKNLSKKLNQEAIFHVHFYFVLEYFCEHYLDISMRSSMKFYLLILNGLSVFSPVTVRIRNLVFYISI